VAPDGVFFAEVKDPVCDLIVHGQPSTTANSVVDLQNWSASAAAA
jgi:hypothetical protein